MGKQIRVIHNGSTLLSTEHRADEYQKGVSAYDSSNLPVKWVGLEWFIADSDDLWDADGILPFESLTVPSPSVARASRTLGVEPTKRDTARQRAKDITPGKGGRLDVLYAKLADTTLTDTEIAEMLRLERRL
jgi:hypothetical protein